MLIEAVEVPGIVMLKQVLGIVYTLGLMRKK